MMVPRPTMEKELKGEEKDLTDDINNLAKKVKSGLSVRAYGPSSRPTVKIFGETVQRRARAAPRYRTLCPPTVIEYYTDCSHVSSIIHPLNSSIPTASSSSSHWL